MSVGFVALLPPADLQSFWKLFSAVMRWLCPSRSGQTLVTDGSLIRWPGHSFPVWRREALFEPIKFAWKDRGEGWKQRPCTFRLTARWGSQLGLSAFEWNLWLLHLHLSPWYGSKEHWSIWIKSRKNWHLEDFEEEFNVINMENLRNNKNPWVLYDTEVPHSRFWWVFLFIRSWKI